MFINTWRERCVSLYLRSSIPLQFNLYHQFYMRDVYIPVHLARCEISPRILWKSMQLPIPLVYTSLLYSTTKNSRNCLDFYSLVANIVSTHGFCVHSISFVEIESATRFVCGNRMDTIPMAWDDILQNPVSIIYTSTLVQENGMLFPWVPISMCNFVNTRIDAGGNRLLDSKHS